MANKISLLGLISVNGVYQPQYYTGQPNPSLIDLTTEKVVHVMVVPALLQNGTQVDAFEIVCSNLKGATPDVYLLQVDPDHCADIDAFYTGLSTITADTTFVKYTNLISVNGAPARTAQSVIINDLHTKNRRYVPERGTLVYAEIHNAYQAKEFVFAGDQTLAGTYTYFPS